MICRSNRFFSVLTVVVVGLPAAIAGAESKEPSVLSIKLARAQMPKDQFNQMIVGLAAQLEPSLAQQLKSQGKTLPKDFQPRFIQAVGQVLSYDDLVKSVAGVFQKHFTAAEMKSIVAFFESPSGKKFLEKQPEVTQEMMAVTMPMLMERIPKIMEKAGIEAPK